MGVDIGFTEESLRDCRYALCRSYQKKIVAIYSEPPEKGEDKLAPYRQVDKVVNMSLLELEEPQLYHELTKDYPPFVRDTIWHWNKAWFNDYFTDRKKASKVRPYVETKPSPRVLLKGMSRELAEPLMEEVGEEHWYSAWWQLPYEKHEQICKPCPIRPLDETNCYIRFSNYPGMNGFRQGFMLTVLYAETIDEQKLKEAFFSFPYVDKTKGELPKDKIGQLIEVCEGTPINKGAERMFNTVVDMLDKVKPEEMESSAEKIDMLDVPFVDEFISKYIYRDDPYSMQETRSLLPYVETLQELADWAIWDTDHRGTRTRVIAFKERIDDFVKALKIADKYGLEVFMSY